MVGQKIDACADPRYENGHNRQMELVPGRRVGDVRSHEWGEANSNDDN